MKWLVTIATLFLSSLSFSQTTKSQLSAEAEYYWNLTDSTYTWDIVNRNDEGDFYHLDKGISALTQTFEATGDLVWLDRVLAVLDALRVQAAPSNSQPCTGNCFNDNFMTWFDKDGGLTTFNQGSNQQTGLAEGHGLRHIYRVLWVLHESPELRAGTYHGQIGYYQQKFSVLFPFFKTNIFDKWYARGLNQIYRSRTHITAHFAYMAFFISLILEDLDPSQVSKYKNMYENWALNMGAESGFTSSMKQQLRVVSSASGERYVWSDEWGQSPPGDVTDSDHATSEVEVMALMHMLGRDDIFTATDMTRLVNTLKDVVFTEASSQTIYGPLYIDGSGGLDRTTLHSSWYILAAFDEELQDRFINKDLTRERAQSTRANMYGMLTYTRSYADNSQVYPESIGSAGGTITTGYPYTFIGGSDATVSGACALTSGGVTYYSASVSLIVGSRVFTDINLNNPLNGGNNYFKRTAGDTVIRIDANGYITSINNCTTGGGGGEIPPSNTIRRKVKNIVYPFTG